MLRHARPRHPACLLSSSPRVAASSSSSLHRLRLRRQSLPKACVMIVKGLFVAHSSAHIFSQLLVCNKTNKYVGQHYATQTLLVFIPNLSQYMPLRADLTEPCFPVSNTGAHLPFWALSLCLHCSLLPASMPQDGIDRLPRKRDRPLKVANLSDGRGHLDVLIAAG